MYEEVGLKQLVKTWLEEHPLHAYLHIIGGDDVHIRNEDWTYIARRDRVGIDAVLAVVLDQEVVALRDVDRCTFHHMKAGDPLFFNMLEKELVRFLPSHTE